MSTSESKRKSSSSPSKASKKKEEQAVDESAVEEVHTANNWENADLGDTQRKQKFLHLMGAKKRKDESGTDRQTSHDSNSDEDVSPDKKHCRSKAETETINKELEQQFNESLQSKINHTYHGGLGFHADSSGASSSGDWQRQPVKTKFVPAKTEAGAALDHVIVESTETEEDKSGDKPEKKKKKTKS